MKGELPQVELYESLLPWRRRPRFFNSFLEKKNESNFNIVIKYRIAKRTLSRQMSRSPQRASIKDMQNTFGSNFMRWFLPFIHCLLVIEPGVVHVVVRWRAVLSAVVHQSRHADVIVSANPKCVFCDGKKNKREICSLVGKTLLPEKWKWVFFCFVFSTARCHCITSLHAAVSWLSERDVGGRLFF